MTSTLNKIEYLYKNRKIEDIPCFKNSFFYGILSGIGGGFLYFMFTSKVKQSCHASMVTYSVATLSYWVYCRHKSADDIKKAALLTKFIREQIANEGTEENKEKVTV